MNLPPRLLATGLLAHVLAAAWHAAASCVVRAHLFANIYSGGKPSAFFFFSWPNSRGAALGLESVESDEPAIEFASSLDPDRLLPDSSPSAARSRASSSFTRLLFSPARFSASLAFFRLARYSALARIRSS